MLLMVGFCSDRFVVYLFRRSVDPRMRMCIIYPSLPLFGPQIFLHLSLDAVENLPILFLCSKDMSLNSDSDCL